MAELPKLGVVAEKMRHFYLGEIGHYYLGLTINVKAKFRCPVSGKVEMSVF
jgi:hypothetical protein